MCAYLGHIGYRHLPRATESTTSDEQQLSTSQMKTSGPLITFARIEKENDHSIAVLATQNIKKSLSLEAALVESDLERLNSCCIKSY